MIITFEGRDWEFDESDIDVRQGIVMYMAHKLTIAEFSAGLVQLDARALQAGYWLMLQQNGIVKPIAECNFKAVPFAEAYANARLAEVEAEKAREAAEKAAADAALDASDRAGAVGPTSLPPDAPQWPGHAYPTDMTPQPAEPRYLPQHGPTGYSPSP